MKISYHKSHAENSRVWCGILLQKNAKFVTNLNRNWNKKIIG